MRNCFYKKKDKALTLFFFSFSDKLDVVPFQSSIEYNQKCRRESEVQYKSNISYGRTYQKFGKSVQQGNCYNSVLATVAFALETTSSPRAMGLENVPIFSKRKRAHFSTVVPSNYRKKDWKILAFYDFDEICTVRNTFHISMTLKNVFLGFFFFKI